MAEQIAEQPPKTRTIVIAVTISKSSQHAFEWYMENIHRSGDHVILFYCEQPLEEPADPYTSHTLDWKKKVRKHDDDRSALIEMYTQKCQVHSQNAKIKVESHHRAGEHICAYAVEQEATYIVLGKRNMSSIRRTLLGGVSDHVVAHSCIPVLVVPAEHTHDHQHEHHH